MIFWMAPVAVAVVFLSWFLLRVLKQYDAESVSTAFERIKEIENRLESVQERLRTLEAIESDLILDSEKSKEMPDSAESLSSGHKPLVE